MTKRRRPMTRENRAVPVTEFRADSDVQGRFRARVMWYDVVDDYNTIFAPGVFADSLQTRLPRIVWQHDWSEPLGRYIDYEDTRDYLDLLGEFDDFMDVPRARQAYAQLKSGTIDQFSVGFMPQDGEYVLRDEREFFQFTRARLDEASLVLAGAVPDTSLLALRSGDAPIVRSTTLVVPKDFAAQVILDVHQGKIDLADALQSIKHQAVAEPGEEEEEEETEPAGETDPPADPPAEDPETPEGEESDPPEDVEDPEGETPEVVEGDQFDPDFSDLDDIDAILEAV